MSKGSVRLCPRLLDVLTHASDLHVITDFAADRIALKSLSTEGNRFQGLLDRFTPRQCCCQQGWSLRALGFRVEGVY